MAASSSKKASVPEAKEAINRKWHPNLVYL